MRQDGTTYDLVCIGNAIIDVISPVSPDVLRAQGMNVGAMTLVDRERAHALHALVETAQETGGGSAANTAVIAARMGSATAYLGKVADDSSGRAFGADLRACGIHFPSAPLAAGAGEGATTARCIVLVTPDGQRTMNTYLGACVHFSPEDVVADVVGRSRVTYLEGYLFDPPHAQDAFRHAAALAHEAGREVALSLSDPFCVGRHRAAFHALVDGHVDLLFANEQEICALYETDDFAEAARQAASYTACAVLTRGEGGSEIWSRGQCVRVPAAPTTVVDTTGAGDAYAAGFLAGWTRGRPLAECGRLGSVAAAEIISHYGARPLADLSNELGR
ncbi:sugar kinase [Ameyamaea chiangmaiensis NBRC 103196]|uniref:Adenosine kinase n=1 Tax=Ameyamaea chiangmaiensis TaxID=442969 RepID=A0A850PI05_9PROT|nr:adenosine kinase [Ameyamaea chiangmaiensis]MBS4073999.1 adenosine kinase [Ameyamaea chiangmaiensis]NVN41452.1 adenosine kinase [Ameyamaea chiangmaiensis]GBQ67657.1 sugar kinase [Ameyamaea chiangmaiensis NBRC 103196]